MCKLWSLSNYTAFNLCYGKNGEINLYNIVQVKTRQISIGDLDFIK